MELRFSIQLPPQDASFGAHGAGASVYVDALHGREIDQEALIDSGVARDVVAAAANGDLQTQFSGERHRIDDVGDAATTGDEGRMFVDEAVVDLAQVVVALIRGPDQSPRERLCVSLVDSGSGMTLLVVTD